MNKLSAKGGHSLDKTSAENSTPLQLTPLNEFYLIETAPQLFKLIQSEPVLAVSWGKVAKSTEARNPDTAARYNGWVRVQDGLFNGGSLYLCSCILIQGTKQKQVERQGFVNRVEEKTRTEKGSPQGGIISPLLTNIYLNRFDQYMKTLGIRIVRYADDILVFASSKSEAGRYRAIATKYLEGELRLSAAPHGITKHVVR